MESGDVIPLDKRVITVWNPITGANMQLPALNSKRVKDMNILAYTEPPSGTNVAAVEQWLEMTSYLCDDLREVLQLPHDEFWCQAVYDRSLIESINSFLTISQHFDEEKFVHVSPAVVKIQKDLYRLFFNVCVRLATCKETKDHVISPSVFADLIYDKYLFDIPKMMDICVLYSQNAAFLTKMIGNIFKLQPKYNEDFKQTIGTLKSAFDTLCERCGEPRTNSPVKLKGKGPIKNIYLSMPEQELVDMMLFFCDSCHSLGTFVGIYPPVCELLYLSEMHHFLALVYESMVPALVEAFQTREFTSFDVKRELQKRQKHAQLSLIRTIRQIIQYVCIEPLLAEKDLEVAKHCVEEFLNSMSSFLSEHRFLAHFCTMFPFRTDIEHISGAFAVDEEHVQFIEEGITEAIALHQVANLTLQNAIVEDMPHTSRIKSGPYTEKQSASTLPSNSKPTRAVAVDYEDESALGACASVKTVAPIELESYISAVKDLFPELGEGFIDVCLKEYNYNVESVINVILENNLPPHLASVDRSNPRQKAATADQQVSLLSQRRNIYDDDEFDVFSRSDVDKSHIFKGKKDKTRQKDLTSKSDILSVKSIYDKYSNEEVWVNEDYEYDDEYDDTYDSNVMGADDADSADELLARRPFTVPRIFSKGPAGDVNGGGEDDGQEDEEQQQQPIQDEFVQNPEIIRQKQEERRALQHQRRTGQPPKQHDVVGGPKGQGQSDHVLHNRSWKQKHKSSQVHHNRKVLADKKRGF